MSRSRLTVLVSSLAVVTAAAGLLPAFAQSALETPAPSPRAKAEQRVGVTDFSIEYSSPGVKGRTIWGGLVPYDELWRTGANAPTKLTASRDFTFGDKVVPAGSYSVLTLPGKSSWTVILNKNTALSGTTGYDTKDDVARVTVTPATSPARERMTFLFSDTTDDATRLDLDWAGQRVSVPIRVDTKAHMQAEMDKTLGTAWRPHYMAGRYLLDSGGDLDTALRHFDTSIAIRPTWSNYWYRAQALAKKGRASDAVASAEKAQQLGQGDSVFESFFKDDVQKALDEWKKGRS
jgi:hypothetical protein